MAPSVKAGHAPAVAAEARDSAAQHAVPTIQVLPDSSSRSRKDTGKPPSQPSSEESKTAGEKSADEAHDTGGKEKAVEPPPPIPTQFVQIDPSDSSNDKTTVDIVTVPCPGADPHKTWTRDALLENFFSSSSLNEGELHETGKQLLRTSIVSPAIRRVLPKAVPSWVRQGIRKEASQARILLYSHREPDEGTTLSALADDLLSQLHELRGDEHTSRPIFFVAHSIGGLVVKYALRRANHDRTYEPIFNDCYGVAFFATPHRGSSYLSMRNLTGSIQNLLQLSVPLPKSIIDDLRVGHQPLLHIDDDFKILASDLQIWTFYETVDSQLSGGEAASGPNDVYFSAPITSIKSAILGIRQESVFPLQSDHASCASFGRRNTKTLNLFLQDLAVHIAVADDHARERTHTPMNLEQKVKIEVHGFYEDLVELGSPERTVRAWSTKLALKDFLVKGPNQCLEDRLNEVSTAPRDSQFLGYRQRAVSQLKTGASSSSTVSTTPGLGQNLLGIMPDGTGGGGARRGSSSGGSSSGMSSSSELPQEPASPDIVLTDPSNHSARPATPTKSDSGLSQKVAASNAAQGTSLHPDHAKPLSRKLSFGRSASEGAAVLPHDPFHFPPGWRNMARRFSDALGMETALEASKASTSAAATRSARRLSESAISQDLQVTFSRPDQSAKRFVWIHLPFTNPVWVKKIFETLEVQDKRDFSELFSRDNWDLKHERGRHSQPHAHFIKPGCNVIVPKPVSPRPNSPKTSLHSVSETTVYNCLFLPYLHFDSYRNLIRRREIIKERLKQGRSRPVPQTVAKLDSLELQVIWEYLGHDPPINCRRTLDQYGYPSLHDTRARDDDQMLYKMTKERILPDNLDSSVDHHHHRGTVMGRSNSGRSAADDESMDGYRGDDDYDEDDWTESDSEEDVLNGNVLMVDQLWMWSIDSSTLLTFFPRRESQPTEGPLFQQADLRDSIFNEVNADMMNRCENALDLAALTALHAVTVLMDRSSHQDLEIFRIFEEAISILTERLTSSLKEFRAQGFRDKAMDYEAVESKARSIRKKHKEEGKRAEKENRDNTSALLELRDIEDELGTLHALFEKQEKVIDAMASNYYRREMKELTQYGRNFLDEALERLGEYKRQSWEMIQRVRGTRDDYDKLLQMVQRQAQVDEVRLSRLQADLASAQSRSVMIFTTFTVIFLPLTFFTGLFGMNTREWGGGTFLSLQTIGIISLPTSAVLILTALVVAWSTRVRRLFRWISHRYAAAKRSVRAYLMERKERLKAQRLAKKIMSRRDQEREKQRLEEKAVRKEKKRLKKEPSHDFWERHRIERDYEYRIPAMNRKSVGRRRAMARARLERETARSRFSATV